MIIDIGSPAIDRPSISYSNSTYILKKNPANASGKITSVEIFAASTLGECKVGIFEQVAPDTFTCRDRVTIGSVPLGYSEHVVDLDVVEEDYIGIFFTSGTLECTNAGEGFWYLGGDQMACVNELFTVLGGRTQSVKGTGESLAWSGKISGVTNPAKVMGIDVSSIKSVKGVE